MNVEMKQLVMTIIIFFVSVATVAMFDNGE